LLEHNQKVLVAVSGGVDSMTLLHSLQSLAKKHRWEISVAHFNHRLRGRGSEADEELVKITAARLHAVGGRRLHAAPLEPFEVRRRIGEKIGQVVASGERARLPVNLLTKSSCVGLSK